MVLCPDTLCVGLGFGSSVGSCGFVILIASKRYRAHQSRNQTSALAKISVPLSTEYWKVVIELLYASTGM